MKRNSSLRWPWLIALVLVAVAWVPYLRTSSGAPRATDQPFANAVQQRGELISQLKKLNSQLAEQNALLRSGKLRVVTVDGN